MSNEIVDVEFKIISEETQESILIEENQQSLPEPIVFSVDPVLLVNEFLKHKDIMEDDSLNLELFLKGDISGWRFKNIPAPSLEELKALESQVSAKISQELINSNALQLLADTDWLIIRELDCGIPCPPDIKQARAEARAKIVR